MLIKKHKLLSLQATNSMALNSQCLDYWITLKLNRAFLTFFLAATMEEIVLMNLLKRRSVDYPE